MSHALSAYLGQNLPIYSQKTVLAKNPVFRPDPLCKLIDDMINALCSGQYSGKNATKENLLKVIKEYEDKIPQTVKPTLADATQTNTLEMGLRNILRNYKIKANQLFMANSLTVFSVMQFLGIALRDLYTNQCR